MSDLVELLVGQVHSCQKGKAENADPVGQHAQSVAKVRFRSASLPPASLDRGDRDGSVMGLAGAKSNTTSLAALSQTGGTNSSRGASGLGERHPADGFEAQFGGCRSEHFRASAEPWAGRIRQGWLPALEGSELASS